MDNIEEQGYIDGIVQEGRVGGGTVGEQVHLQRSSVSKIPDKGESLPEDRGDRTGGLPGRATGRVHGERLLGGRGGRRRRVLGEAERDLDRGGLLLHRTERGAGASASGRVRVPGRQDPHRRVQPGRARGPRHHRLRERGPLQRLDPQGRVLLARLHVQPQAARLLPGRVHQGQVRHQSRARPVPVRPRHSRCVPLSRPEGAHSLVPSLVAPTHLYLPALTHLTQLATSFLSFRRFSLS